MIHDGAGTGGRPGDFVVGDKGGDALAGETADLDSAGRHRFGAITAEVTIEAQDAKARPEALLGMRPV